MIGGSADSGSLRVPPISATPFPTSQALSAPAKLTSDFAAELKDATPPATRSRKLHTAARDGVNLGTEASRDVPIDPRARDAAAKMVSQLFYIPMLQEMRSFSFGKEIGGGGRGEEVFGEQLDIRLADAMARADRGGAVDQVARQIQKR